MTIYNTDLYLNFWNNPYRFADSEDILESPSKAIEYLRDTLVNRPTELEALLNLALRARAGINTAQTQPHYTRRQSEAVKLALVARANGQDPAQYTANRLKVSKSAVYRLWKRAESKMVTNSEKLPVVSEGKKHKSWYPTESQIKAQIARTERICAGCGITMHTGRYALCWDCGERFGHTREEWSQSKRSGEPAPARWLLPEARRIDREIRKEAINELFRANGFEGADFEEALEQYQQAS